MTQEKLLLSKTFSKQLNIGTALSNFIDNILEIFGEKTSVYERRPITFSEYLYVEMITFSNGFQIRTSLKRNPETFEIEAFAYSEPNHVYLSNLTSEELYLMYSLVKKERENMLNQKYADVDQQKLEVLSSLLMNLKVITGEII
ncbi:hypothetical protein BCR24_15460 [Enterococcus ureilyticus]|uniref:Uncharacterized protein n=1 Tax=Enterococcus ureilyticus TaxID=1131292 RepID=A0A1E5HCB5_9ENTE|nr:hypothetical protein [Enterococcus ureilyticus]MBM7690225.1 hypothetical protein [Enterococcus ureilyticus]OEG22466.1 hypothetical protein BCR24_15460 [Enterococcus ureilyticus]